jgi:hypothetical protein
MTVTACLTGFEPAGEGIRRSVCAAAEADADLADGKV